MDTHTKQSESFCTLFSQPYKISCITLSATNWSKETQYFFSKQRFYRFNSNVLKFQGPYAKFMLSIAP